MKTAFISAGHSDRQPGASGRTSDGRLVREEKYVTELRDYLARVLTARGVSFRTDGRQGENLPLRESVRRALTCDGVRVEFHLNASKRQSATGVEVLARPHHKALAQSLARTVANVLGLPLRGDAGYRPENAGQHHRLAFVSQGGGMICELAFVSNPANADLLVSRSAALGNALADWFTAQAGREVPAPSPQPSTERQTMNTAILGPRALMMSGVEQPEGGSGDGPPPVQEPLPPTPVGPQPVPPPPPPRAQIADQQLFGAPKLTLTAKLYIFITERLRAFLTATGACISGTLLAFWQWTVQHRVELLLAAILAGVCVLLVMQFRKEARA